jgi:hypothetical protein
MKLEFERIYEDYLILTKKRYIATVANKDGKITETIKKGIVLARRDNCPLVRKIYLEAAQALLVCKTQKGEEDIVYNVVNRIIGMFQMQNDLKDFVITKSIAKDEYKTKTLPAHVALSKRMASRGVQVGNGSRIEYIFTTKFKGQKAGFSQGDKVEDYDYFKLWKEFLKIDYLYYLEKQFIKPIDELLRVGFTDINTEEKTHSTERRPYAGERKCSECKNNCYYIYKGKFVCGKHIPPEERNEKTHLERRKCPITDYVYEQYRFCYNKELYVDHLKELFSPALFEGETPKKRRKPLERKKTDEEKKKNKEEKEKEKETAKKKKKKKDNFIETDPDDIYIGRCLM